jgi:polyisoprenoid-binding protein YceI
MRMPIIVPVIIAVILPAIPLGAQEYHVDTTAQRLVRFISKAPLDNFDGITSRIDGYAVIPPNVGQRGQSYDSTTFYFEVDLNSLDTGTGLRNRHMRENYLETDSHPFARYAGRISGMDRGSDTAFFVSATGELTIHGVKRPLAAMITAVKDRQRYHVRTQFPVALPDFKIKVPKLMFMKISDTVQVQVDFYLYPVSNTKEGQ